MDYLRSIWPKSGSKYRAEQQQQNRPARPAQRQATDADPGELKRWQQELELERERQLELERERQLEHQEQAQPRQPTFAFEEPVPVNSQEGYHEEEMVQNASELQERYEEMMKKKRIAKKKAMQIEPSLLSTETPKRSLDLKLNQLGQKEAMKAVVWAEVLGRPRSRQTHQAFQRSRRIR